MGSKAVNKLSVLVLILFFVGFYTKYTLAMPNKTYGITVSPVIEQVNLQKNKTNATFQATIINNTVNPVVMGVSAQNFTSYGVNGKVTFIAPGSGLSHAHGIVSVLSFNPSNFALGVGKQQTVTITINNANELRPGGHYGVIIYRVISIGNNSGNNIEINQAVSTLLFVSTYGGGTQALNLSAIGLGHVITSIPTHLNFVLANTGNTQTTPRGYVRIMGHNNKLIAQGIFNVDSGMILPGGKRLFSLSLNQTTKAFPGIYQLHLYYRHDGQMTYTEYIKSLLLINWWVIIGMAVFLTALLILLLWLLRKKFASYKNKTWHIRHS